MSIEPHGGRLIDRRLTGEDRQRAIEEATGFPRLTLDAWEVSDLELIANGAFSPLEGFMKEDDYYGVINNMRLSDGTIWTIPIVLGVTPSEAEQVSLGERAGLYSEDGTLLGLIEVGDIYEGDKNLEAEKVYRTTEEAHPGVKRVYQRDSKLIGGKISLVNRIKPKLFPDMYLDPVETRHIFEEKGWKRIVAFQTRNPIHRAHEYLQKCAMEICDGL
ncbi:MAG TPA: sulfate adenylyltransferase, partial [Verrucomicrobiae bacterium]|nr:sulfate adenylyltransferase [Verrucomicrobiae bacterium]